MELYSYSGHGFLQKEECLVEIESGYLTKYIITENNGDDTDSTHTIETLVFTKDQNHNDFTIYYSFLSEFECNWLSELESIVGMRCFHRCNRKGRIMDTIWICPKNEAGNVKMYTCTEICKTTHLVRMENLEIVPDTRSTCRKNKRKTCPPSKL